MKYIDDMTDKYGFGDGGGEPREARSLRSVYVAVINEFAARTKSEFRTICYDRPGMHNSCMVLFVKLATLSDKFNEAERVALLAGSEEFDGNIENVTYQATDMEFKAAFLSASDLDPPLEDLVEVTVRTDKKEFRKTLSDIIKGKLTLSTVEE